MRPFEPSESDAETNRALPRIRPKDAATLVILDPSGRKPRVLMGRRHGGHRFMPGQFVFPGGRIERGDARMATLGDLPAGLHEALRQRTPDLTPLRAKALALAAIRETFEETGLVLGQPCALMPRLAAGLPPAWAEFAGTGHLPDLEPLACFARAITPPGLPRRFDTRFFLVSHRAIRFEVSGKVGPDTELTELRWLGLDETADLPLPEITRIVLAELAARLDGGPAVAPGYPFFFTRQRRLCREVIG